jgi:hypothetical protein
MILKCNKILLQQSEEVIRLVTIRCTVMRDLRAMWGEGGGEEADWRLLTRVSGMSNWTANFNENTGLCLGGWNIKESSWSPAWDVGWFAWEYWSVRKESTFYILFPPVDALNTCNRTNFKTLTNPNSRIYFAPSPWCLFCIFERERTIKIDHLLYIHRMN